MVQAVIFDCDGVLVDSEILAHEVETAVLHEIGLHYDRHEFTARFMGMSDAAFFAALGSRRPGAGLAARSSRKSAARLTNVCVGRWKNG